MTKKQRISVFIARLQETADELTEFFETQKLGEAGDFVEQAIEGVVSAREELEEALSALK